MSDGMGLGLDLSGLGQEPMAPAVDVAQLSDAIRHILKDADLEQLSRRMIRKQLEAQFHTDLSSYKDVINATILEKKATPKKRKRKTEGEDGKKAGGGGFNAQLSLSPELAQVVGAETMARPQVVKALWAYIREHDLQDPNNKKTILLDDTLRGPDDMPPGGWSQIPRDGVSSDEDTEAKAAKKKPAKKKKKATTTEDGRTTQEEKEQRLASLTGSDRMARPQIVKALWAYIHEHNLQDPDDKRSILLDDRMKQVFQRDSFTMFSMNKFIKRHARKPDDVPPGGWAEIPRNGLSSDEDEAKTKKRHGKATKATAETTMDASVIASFREKVVQKPEVFFTPSEEVAKEIKAFAKHAYDRTSKYQSKSGGAAPLEELYVDGFDADQMTQRIRTFHKNTDNILLFPSEKQEESEEEEEEEQKDKLGRYTADSDEEEKEVKNSKKKKAKKARDVAEDGFFDWDEMDKAAEEEEEDEDDEDMDGDDDENEEDDDESEMEEDSDAEAAEEMKFEDFFGAEGEEEGEEEGRRQRRRGYPTIKRAKPDEEENVDDEELAERGIMSSHQRQRQHLEHEAISEKPWLLKGEVRSAARPENSLLEAVLDYDRPVKAAPVITEEVSIALEEMIKKRILEDDYDDVIRKFAGNEEDRKNKLEEVSMEKSKEGLGEIYEKEYMKTAMGFEADDESKQDQEEIEVMFKSLCWKLDALSNYHFTPKPAVKDCSVSDANLKAPEEVYEKKRKRGEAVLQSKEEMTQTERKALRNAKKHARRKEKRQREFDERLVAKLNPGLGNKYEKKKMLESIAGAKNITTGTQIEGSSKQFSNSKSSSHACSDMKSETEAVYGHPLMCASLPADVFPQRSVPARVAHQLIKDELALDGNPKMNLASFAEDLMVEGLRKNYIDLDQYPQTAEIHNRCVTMLANLYHAPLEPGQTATGTGCIGSSEAIMLAGLAMKRKWKDRRIAAGLPYDKPNMVFGSNVQVCWHKMCKYFEIEIREADVSPDCLVLTAKRARALLDENTIGVSAILGSTFNGEYEDVKAIHDMLVEENERNGWNIPLHVDAASGGFIAPFLSPELEWDFRLPNVKSINVSGHKFGLVYAGMGWALWREPEDLPDDLVFHVNYLGGDQASFTLNFSKGAGNVVAQYYNMLRFGFEGYRRIMEASMENAQLLRGALVATGHFRIVDKQHMPLVAFALIDSSRYSCFDIQDKLKSRGWIVPAYTCSSGAESLAIMRDILKAIEALEKHHILVDTAMSSPKAEKKHFKDIVHSLQANLKHQKSGLTTHGVC
ncbi:SWIB domain [Phytophthora cactorum]|nr:SWIB domain [Phytophthora cactorum]